MILKRRRDDDETQHARKPFLSDAFKRRHCGMRGPLPGLIVVGSGAAVVIPYVIRFLAVPIGFIKARFERIPRDYDDSARAYGAGQATTMRLIHLPLLRPSMLGAVIVVFVDCLRELPATLLLRPMNIETLATSIYQFASRGSFEEGALAALLIIAASIGPVAWLTRFSDRPSRSRRRRCSSSGSPSEPRRVWDRPRCPARSPPASGAS